METAFKSRAIALRKNGLTYSEILEQVPVAKSTLSLWLKTVGLSKEQKQRITDKKLCSAHRGGEIKRDQRIELTRTIHQAAKRDVTALINNPLWLSGVMLYWGEGTKQRARSISQKVAFSNSDPQMIKTFMLWLKKILDIDKNRLTFELYIHENGDVNKALNYWSKICSCKRADIRVYFKRNNIRTKRSKTGDDYHGLVRVVVRKSSTINRQISGWIDALCEYWGIV